MRLKIEPVLQNSSIGSFFISIVQGNWILGLVKL